MALQLIPGGGFYLPKARVLSGVPAFASTVIDATGEMMAWCGQVFNKDRATKSVTKVGFRFGTVTKAGGSALTVSLQDVLLTAAACVPDETQDQTVAIANADANFASNTFYTTAALSANRSVAFGELLAVVVEYDGAGRLGADAVNFSNFNWWNSQSLYRSVVTLKSGGSWGTVAGHIPNVLLEFTDGTFGTLVDGFPCSAVNTHTFNSGSGGADEYALELSFPFPVKVDGGWALVNISGTSADLDFVLYDGTTAMTSGTTTIDAHAIGTSNVVRLIWFEFAAAISLTANTTYRLAIKPTTANNVSVYSMDVSTANHLQACEGGTPFAYATRLDAGAWSSTTTRRIIGGVGVCAFDDAVGGGGGIGRLVGYGIVH